MITKTSKPRLNRLICDEAAEWFVDFRVADVDAAGRARFDQWLRQSPEHIRAYIEVAKIYVDLPFPEASVPIEVDRLIDLARKQGNVVAFGTSSAVRPSVRSAWRPARALAATVVVTCVAVGVGTWFLPPRYATYETQIGERRLITLADHSTIDLNARSRVRVRLTRSERDVELSAGQALFEVSRDKARPFIVRSNDAIVRAVGTQFDVNRTRSGTTVTVIEGRVAVTGTKVESASPPDRQSGRTPPEDGSAAAVFLDAGEQITVTPRGRSTPERARLSSVTAWTQHRVVFDGSRLSDVVEEFNRYNTRQLLIDDSNLDDFRISGRYSSTDPASLLRFLRTQPGIRVIETDKEVRITRE